MQAIIFSAGLGTRLKPLTNTMPKALIPLGGKPLLQWNIEKLIHAGCDRIIINIHHFPEMIENFLKMHNNFKIDIRISDETESLLDTGGGLIKAAGLFRKSEPIIAHNVDVISRIDIHRLLDFHLKNENMATLVVRDRPTQRYLLFNSNMQLTGWMNIATGEKIIINRNTLTGNTPFAFSGIQIINPKLLQLVKETGKFSIIETYLQFAADYPIYGYIDHSSLWMDLGKPDQIKLAEQLLAKQ
jgi:NDP-sugar pyrophosphorylase family protein